MAALTIDRLENKHLYFNIYMAIPLVFPIAYFFTMDDTVAIIAFYVATIACMIFDQKEMVKSGYESEPQFVASALGIIIFPAIYVYGRTKAAGLNVSKRWIWFFAYIVIGLGCTFITIVMGNEEALKTSACDVTTSIFEDKGSNVKCLVVEDMKKISDKNYRAKAVLSNGMDIPITIEEQDDDYIYVTFVPLSNLLD